MAEAPHDTDVSDVGSDYDPEAEIIGNWKIVDLPEVTIVPPEANYDILSKFNAKLFRWKEH